MSQSAPKVAISLDFFGAYSKLPSSQQTKVRLFVEKFKRDPMSSGINYEKIQNASDPNFRSVRIDKAYRGIVLKPEQGNVFMLLWVARHDDAYDWACRRACRIHPETGAVQIVVLDEVAASDIAEAPAVQAAVPGVFDHVKEKYLLRLGVPEENIGRIRGITDPYELKELSGQLPEEAFEALSFLASGSSVEEVLDTYAVTEDRAAVDTEDFDAALENPDSLRRFFVVDDEVELQAILNAPLEKWRVFLHPSQRKLVERDWNGPVRVLGGAGTGKTVVAIHRAKWLLQHRFTKADDRILFTTFTRNLAADIKENLAKLCTSEQMKRVEVVNLDSWVSSFLRKHGYPHEIDYNNRTRDLWTEALSKRVDSELPTSFYREEWEQVVQPQEVTSFKGYARAKRVGRGVRLNLKRRKAVWPVFEEYRALLDEHGLREAEDAMREARQLLAEKGDILPYRAVIVDEAQDMGYQAFRLLRQIIPEEAQNDMMIVGDAHQRIYRNKVVLGRCGVRIVGRSKKLRVNYRTTEEIRRWAVQLLEGLPFDDLDGGLDHQRDYTSLMFGLSPRYEHFDGLSEEVAFLVKELKEQGADALKDICLVTRTAALRDRYKKLLEGEGIATYELKRSQAEDRTAPGLRLATMHRVKGLEFDRLLLPGLNEGVMPFLSDDARSEDQTIAEEHERRERSLLYVSVTRARQDVLLTSYEKPSPFLTGEQGGHSEKQVPDALVAAAPTTPKEKVNAARAQPQAMTAAGGNKTTRTSAPTEPALSEEVGPSPGPSPPAPPLATSSSMTLPRVEPDPRDISNLDKQCFRQFAEFDCERQLFLSVAGGEESWFSPYRELKPRSEERTLSEISTELGKRYEQAIYRSLRHLPGTRYNTNRDDEVAPTSLDATQLRKLYEHITNYPHGVCLLEHQWQTPTSMLRWCFGLEEGQALAQHRQARRLRPDILVLKTPPHDGPLTYQLHPDGRTSQIEPGTSQRVGIHVIDIKHTNEQSVGRRHFIELFFYSLALAHWLEQMGLQEQFFVCKEPHGILPRLEERHAYFASVEQLFARSVELVWDDAYPVFHRTREVLARLWSQSPCAIEDVELSIQPSCGRCPFLEDCKFSLGQDGETPPEEWDLRLLPYTSRSTAEQLRQQGLRKVKDVIEQLPALSLEQTPTPLYAERPLLVLKAAAMASQQAATAPGGDPDGHLSVAIPRYTDIALVFDVEADPTHDVVFGAGFLMEMSVHSSAPFAQVFASWWETWGRLREEGGTADAIDVDEVIQALDQEYLAHWSQAAPEHGEADVAALIRQFATACWPQEEDDPLRLYFPSEPGQGIRVQYVYSYISGDIDLSAERTLAVRLLEHLHRLLVLCNVVETLVGVLRQGHGDKSYAVTPSFGLFYWSHEQLTHIEDLLERHLLYLSSDARLRKKLLQLLGWLTPSDSGVRHYFQHKKLYDLRTFLETCLGLPHPINYTWHDIQLATKAPPVSRKYWPMHFNYMDFSTWHGYLKEADSNRKFKLYQRMNRELSNKLKRLHYIRREFQQKARASIAQTSRPIEARRLQRSGISEAYHPIARFWYLYAKLTGAVQELDVEQTRLTYPAASVGKLTAAEATSLEFVPVDHKQGRFHFLFQNMSANTKLLEGAFVVLLPHTHRELRRGQQRAWSTSIDSMEWSQADGGYKVSTGPISLGSGHPFFGMSPGEVDATHWYIYPIQFDIWSGRLGENKGHLLSRSAMGDSWLGWRLSFLWQFGEVRKLEAPPQAFGLPEVYLYAPDWLPLERSEGDEPLQTSLFPPPDHSQQQAIRTALSRVISCIQGPPGTGKSQTIVALIDEFLTRRDGPARILVTGFSYPSLQVVLDKIAASCDASGQPTKAAQVSRVFVRSAHRTATHTPGTRDLYKDGSQWSLDGEKIHRGSKRYKEGKLDGMLGDSFIMFANAFQLYHFGAPGKDGYKDLSAGFGFDLIIADEASQLPIQHFLASVSLLKPGQVFLEPKDVEAMGWPLQENESNATKVANMRPVTLPPMDSLTKVVIVGDHNQLPPVQPVQPPRQLRKLLDSLFTYYIDGHELPYQQLQINYRSHPTIVAFTSRLGLYQDLRAHHTADSLGHLPAVASDKPLWLRQLLAPETVVSSIVHQNSFETAVSHLEAMICGVIVEAFYEQLSPEDAEQERLFWQRHIGIVAPHNAHGRLILREIFGRLSSEEGRLKSHLSLEELMTLLGQTIYSVEKFQGSDRTFILASMGISSQDQLSAEEAFIYDMNRLNVLTSRAKQKMLLVCSQHYLDYIPHERELIGHAAKIRSYVEEYCQQQLEFDFDEGDGTHPLQLRWR